MEAGAWSGYTLRIQVRPDAIGTYVWAGGYLRDGLFIQSGMLMPGSEYSHPGEAKLFAWATSNTGDATNGALPLAWVSVPDVTVGSWWTFRLTRTRNVWTFRYRDPAGVWHRQGAFRRASPMMTASVIAEYWADGPSDFGTQAVRGFRLRSGSSWVLPPMVYGPPEDQCGRESVTSLTPGNLVFQSKPGACVPWTVLWK